MTRQRWIPNVGEIVQHKGSKDILRVLGVFKGYVWGEFVKSNQIITCALSRVSPIPRKYYAFMESQVEKLEECLGITGAGKKRVKAESLFNQGVRVLEPDEKICKALTEGEMAQIKQEISLYMELDGTLRYVADVAMEAVQDKLGLIDT